MSIRSEKKRAFQWNSWWTRVRQVALIQVCKEFLHKRVECTFLWQLGYWSGSGRHDLLLVFVHSLSSGKVQKKTPLSCHIYTPWILQDIEDDKHLKKKIVVDNWPSSESIILCNMHSKHAIPVVLLPVIAKAWGVLLLFFPLCLMCFCDCAIMKRTTMPNLKEK